MTPTRFLYLANRSRRRRPGQEVPAAPPELAGLLEGMSEDGMDRLTRAASRLADAITADRRPLPLAPLNALARHAASFPRLVVIPTPPTLRLEHVPLPTDPAAAVAAQVLDELARADLTRIKECARPQCTLVFYDTTRSRTGRWHAQSPCGQLERQRRHRAR